MTPQRFKLIRHHREMTQAEIARILRVDVRTVKRYESGQRSISGPVAVIMNAMLDDQPGIGHLKTILGIIRKPSKG